MPILRNLRNRIAAAPQWPSDRERLGVVYDQLLKYGSKDPRDIKAARLCIAALEGDLVIKPRDAQLEQDAAQRDCEGGTTPAELLLNYSISAYVPERPAPRKLDG